MSIEDFINSAGASKQFVSTAKLDERIAQQIKATPVTLETLRHLEDKPSEALRLEFFFYTNSAGKAKEFSDFLKTKNYSAEYHAVNGKKNLFCITGWTTKIPMDEKSVMQWTTEMCESGFQYDCEFDGWGTTPDQE